MYAGHLGIALALRARRDAPPLWLLAFAAQACDWGDVVAGLVFAGLRVRPSPAYGSHGLVVVAAVTGVAALAGARVATRAGLPRGRGARLVAVAAASHWVADCLTGRKPTIPGGPTVGLGLFGHPGLDLLLETVVVIAGWALWSRALRARRTPPLAWMVLALLLALQAGADLVMAHNIGLQHAVHAHAGAIST